MCNFWATMKRNFIKFFIFFLTSCGLFAQVAQKVVMVRPDYFRYNAETAVTNAFQRDSTDQGIRKKALAEFNGAVQSLKDRGVEVLLLSSPPFITPDAVFPNNWFSIHKEGSSKRFMVLYPMLTPNRREERQVEALSNALAKQGVVVNEILDFTEYEKEDRALEGTGSMVLDRTNGVAYAALSPRTDEGILEQFCHQVGYKPVSFYSQDRYGNLIYHTNVMMSLGNAFCVVCLESIKDRDEKARFLGALLDSKKEVIEISHEQVEAMCGNILQLQNTEGEYVIVMSKSAEASFTKEQLIKLRKYGEILPLEISTIEAVGGGSARCMLAEVF